MKLGMRVEVRSRFDQRWARGFEVVEVLDEDHPRYRVRRQSDGSILPVLFDDNDLREDRRRQTWWM